MLPLDRAQLLKTGYYLDWQYVLVRLLTYPGQTDGRTDTQINTFKAARVTLHYVLLMLALFSETNYHTWQIFRRRVLHTGDVVLVSDH